jgi:hypothetical protein
MELKRIKSAQNGDFYYSLILGWGNGVIQYLHIATYLLIPAIPTHTGNTYLY